LRVLNFRGIIAKTIKVQRISKVCWEKVYKLKTQITRPHSKEKEQKLKEQRLKDKRRKISREKISREKISSYNLILAFLFLACLSSFS
jgi:hypothetical protein